MTLESRDLLYSSPSFGCASLSSFPVVGGVDDEAFLFDETAQPDRTEVDVEESLVNLLEADVLALEELADGHAVVVPPDTTVSRYETSLEVAGIGDGLQGCREGSG